MTNSPTYRVGIVADDLTSATDGASPLCHRGHVARISRDIDTVSNAAILSIDTDSRSRDPSVAALRTGIATARLSDREILYKTIDSTLRGHIGAEVMAAARAAGRKRLVIAPAFPDAGRITINGIQMVHGIPVSESSYRNDPVHPALVSGIADLFSDALGPMTIVSSSDDMRRALARGDTNLILDADTQAVLDARVASVIDPHDVLWIGSPGLAIALANLVQPKVPPPEGCQLPDARVLVVSGSANAVSHAQCDHLLAEGIPVADDLGTLPADAPIACLRAPLLRHADPKTILSRIVDNAGQAMTRLGYNVVIATGGETMAAILDHLSITSFDLIGELEPGFAVGLVDEPGKQRMIIATKAGGFGTPETLARAARSLLAGRPVATGAT
jgi:D-threonate/D-erythronate kinase